MDAKFCSACGTPVSSNIAGRDNFSASGNTNSNIQQGTGNTLIQPNDTSNRELAEWFARVYYQIQERPEDPNVDKQELERTVRDVQQEAIKGEEANPNKIERWLSMLAEMAPDIWDVTVATLTSPAAGVATVIKKIAAKAKEEATQPS